MIREAFGDEMTIYADSNGSYDAQEGIRIGKILEANGIDFYDINNNLSPSAIITITICLLEKQT